MHNRKCIICDLDGTLALLNGRNPYDASTAEQDILNDPVAEIVKHLAAAYDIILISGRTDTWRAETERWLQKHQVPYVQLFMRKEGDFRKDVVVKREFFAKYIKSHWDVLFVLDDRNQVVEMWREVGLTCLQVAPGDF